MRKISKKSEEAPLERGMRIGDYIIYTDQYNFIVGHVATVQDEGSANYGNEYVDGYTYHATLQQAVKHMLTETELQNIQNLDLVLKKHDEVLANLERLQELKRK